MRRVLGVFLMVLGGAVAAQQTPFKAGVSLVTVDVTVIDKDGNPVPGLSADDFEVKLAGKIQPVRAISFVRAATPADTPAAAASKPAAPVADLAPKPASAIVAKEVEIRRTISNQDVSTTTAASTSAPPTAPIAATVDKPAQRAHQSEPRVFVIVVDDLSFFPQNGKKLFAAARRFVDTVPASDPVGFTTTSGSATVNPTMDRASVKAALSKAVGEFQDPRGMRKSGVTAGGKSLGPDQPIGFDEAIDIERGDESALMKVISRECLQNQKSEMTVQQLQIVSGTGPDRGGGGAGDTCVQDVVNEAKRTAALLRQLKGRQMAALIGVLNAMRTASGIRHMVLMTDGMAIQRDVIDLQPLTKAAAASGVQFSVVMEEPDSLNMNTTGRTGSIDGGNAGHDTGLDARQREDNRLMLNGAQTFTDMVGGVFYKVIGDADPSFARILTASSAVYRIGVEMPSGMQAGKEMSLGVNVKKPGLTVRANKMAINTPDLPASVPAPSAGGASVGKPEAPPQIVGPVPASIEDVLKAALNENQSLRGVPIRLAATLRRSTNAAGQIDVSVSVQFPSSVQTPITALVGLVDETNALKISRKIVESTAGPVQFLFPLAPGSYAIRFGAAGADKALGTVELPIAVKLHAMGAFTSSDVLTFFVGETSQKATLYSLDEPPATTEKSTYHASIELYPNGAMPDEPPVVNWTVVREGETKPVFDEDSEGRVGTSLFRSDIELPFESLAPGTYIVRATLMVGDKPAGTVAATVRKR